MPDGLDWPTWVLVVGGIGGISTALLAVIGLAVKTGRGVTWLADIARDSFVEGAREAMTSIVDERVTRAVADLEARLAPQIAELAVNGGDSIKDRVAKILLATEDLPELKALVVEHVEHSRLDRQDIRRWLEHLDPGRHTDPRVPPTTG